MLNLLWRAATSSMSTKARLVHKHAIDFGRRPICGRKDETIIHALVNCEFAKEAWANSA